MALVSREGDVLGAEAEPTPVLLRPGGGAEQRPADWWQAVSAASRRLLDGRAVDVCGVAVTGQWGGSVAVGEDGRSLGDALIWLDARGARHARRVAGGRIRISGYDPRKVATWLRLTGGAPSLSGRDALGHLLWLRAERPEVYAAAACILEPVDWIGLRLTGRAATTPVTATLHWLTDTRAIERIAYDERLLALAGVDRGKLPELLPTNAVLGPLTVDAAHALGLPRGVPVVAGTPDSMASAVGSGAVADHAAHLYVGTSSWLSCHVPYRRLDPLHAIAALPSAVRGRYLVSCEQQTAGASLELLRDLILPGAGAAGFAALDRLAADAPVGSDGVIFTPWLNGERTPVDDHLVRGGLHNLALGTTRGHVARAVLEGVALNARWMQHYVERFCRRRLEPVAFVGGGARSAVWGQIMADTLGRTVHRVGDPLNAGVRGAGLLAWLALGDLRPEDLHGRASVTAVHQPRGEHAATYDKLFAAFRDLYRANRRVRGRLAALRPPEDTSR